MPSNETVEIVRGDSKTLKRTLKSTVNGVATAVNLTGYTVYVTVKKEYSDTTAVIALDSLDVTEVKITSAAEGKIEIYFLPANTKSLDAGTYVWEVRAKKTTSLLTFNIGDFTILNEVNKTVEA
jgi:hypothetical protein